ncbi:hypothetical protein ACVIWU_006725 [Bradyrhizobium sp. USDA 4509]
MHGTICTHDASPENAPDTLVTETDAKDWDTTRKFADNRGGYTGLHGSAGAGRYDDCARLERSEFSDADRITSDYLRLCTKLAEIARNVEYEGIVVVDDDNQNAPYGSASKASNNRFALARVSSYSASGFDIAVIPPPA